jgi:hypothetical protein
MCGVIEQVLPGGGGGVLERRKQEGQAKALRSSQASYDEINVRRDEGVMGILLICSELVSILLRRGAVRPDDEHIAPHSPGGGYPCLSE